MDHRITPTPSHFRTASEAPVFSRPGGGCDDSVAHASDGDNSGEVAHRHGQPSGSAILDAIPFWRPNAVLQTWNPVTGQYEVTYLG